MANSLAAVEMLDVLLTTARRPIFKLILVMYLLIELLPNDVINWAAEAFTSGESKQFINGKVLRVLVFHVTISLDKLYFYPETRIQGFLYLIFSTRQRWLSQRRRMEPSITAVLGSTSSITSQKLSTSGSIIAILFYDEHHAYTFIYRFYKLKWLKWLNETVH